jgi:glucose-1-phosphate cytidylyltransferase
MKAVILAGGFGTRLSEETSLKPKPMVEIGGKPILWHIMKIYYSHGINEFIICCGYKGYIIKEYFQNYFLHTSDITFDMKNNEMKVHKAGGEAWKVTLVDTGDNSMTGGRLGRLRDYLIDEELFCFTYGDGVSDVNITELIKFHKKNNKLATMTAAYPPGRFGAITIEDNLIKSFEEKPKGDGSYVNAGFFVLNPGIFKYIKDDSTIWEQSPLKSLANDNELVAFKHNGFWQPMDTLRDKNKLQELWLNQKAPWKIW